MEGCNYYRKLQAIRIQIEANEPTARTTLIGFLNSKTFYVGGVV